jgi:peroxiredoxin Q/BCP
MSIVSRIAALALTGAMITGTAAVVRAEKKEEAAAGPKVGDKAPEFTAKDQDGKDVSLKDFAGKKAVILWFFPKAMTGGCTKEGCAFRDDIKKFEDAGAQVIGISCDKVEDQKKFAEKEKFPYPLLSDADGAIAKAYGVALKEAKGGHIPNRSTFVIDKDGKLVYVNHKVDIPKQNASLLELLGKAGK